MANRYWRGGSGTWSNTSTTNWSATSGGAGGASVPTTVDDVFFDQAATYTVTLSSTLNCRDLNISAGTVTFANSSFVQMNIVGNISTISNTIWNGQGNLRIAPAAGTVNITTNNVVVNSNIFMNAATTATLQLLGNVTLHPSKQMNLTSGTVSLGSNTLTIGSFISTAANANAAANRALNFGTGKIVLNSDTTATIWNSQVRTRFTLTGTNKLVECAGGVAGTANITKTINTGAIANTNDHANLFDISFVDTRPAGNGLAIYTFANGAYFSNVIINGNQAINTNQALNFYGGLTYNNTNGNTTFLGTSTWAFNSRTASDTLTINPVVPLVIPNPLLILGANGNVIFANNTTLTLSNVSHSVTIQNANVNFNQPFSTLNANQLVFQSPDSRVRNLNQSNLTVDAGGLTLEANAIVGNFVMNGTITLTNLNLNCFTFTSTTQNKGIVFGNTGQVDIRGGNIATPVMNIASGTTSFTGNVRIRSTYTGSGTNPRIFLSSINSSQATSGTHSGWDIKCTGDLGIIVGNTATDKLGISGNYRQVDLTNLTQNVINNTRVIFGNLIVPATGGNLEFGANITTFETRDSLTDQQRTQVLNGRNLNCPVTINASSEFTPVTFSDGLNLPGNFNLVLQKGNLNFPNTVITAGGFVANTVIANSRINFGDTGRMDLIGSNGTSGVLLLGTSANIIDFFGVPTVRITGGNTFGVTKSLNPGSSNLANQMINFEFFDTSNTQISVTANSNIGSLNINGFQRILWSDNLRVGKDFFYSNSNGNTIFQNGNPNTTLVFVPRVTPVFVTASTPAIINNTFVNIGGVVLNSNINFSGSFTFDATKPLNITGGGPYTLDFTNATINGFNAVNVNTNTTMSGLNTSIPLNMSSGGTLILGSNLQFSNIGHTIGTINLNNNVLTGQRYNASSTNGRTLAFSNAGTSEMVLTGSNTTIIDMSSATNWIWTGTTLKIRSTYTGSTGNRTINIGSLTASAQSGLNVSVNGSNGIIIGNATDNLELIGSFNSIDLTDFNGTLTNRNRNLLGSLTLPVTGGNFEAGANITALNALSPNTINITTNDRLFDMPIVFNGNGNYQLSGNLNLGVNRYLDLRGGNLLMNNFNITVGQFFSNSSTTVRSVNFGTGKFILLGNLANTIINTNPATNLSFSGSNLFESKGGGTSIIKSFDFGSTGNITNNVNISLVDNSSTVTYNFTTGSIKDLVIDGIQTVNNFPLSISGNFTHSNANGTTTFTAGANTWTFAGTGNKSITTISSQIYDFPWTFNGVGSNWTFNPALSQTQIGNSRTITLSNGALTLNDQIISAGFFSSNNANVRSINFGIQQGTLRLYGNTGNIVNIDNMSNFSYTGTPRIYSTPSNVSTNRRFIVAGGTLSYSNAFVANLPNNVFDLSLSAFDINKTGLVVQQSTDSLTFDGTYANYDLTGLTSNITTSNLFVAYIAKNFTVPATGGNLPSNTFVFMGSNSTQFITTNGRVLPCKFKIGQSGLAANPQDPIWQGNVVLNGALTFNNSTSFDFTHGNLDLNNFTLTARDANLADSGVANAYDLPRRLNFGTTGQMALTGGDTAVTLIDCNRAGNFSFTGTPKIVSTYTGNASATRTFTLGNAIGFTDGNRFSLSTDLSTGIILTGANSPVSLLGQVQDLRLANLASTFTWNNFPVSVFGNFYVNSALGTFTGGANAYSLAGNSGNFTIDTNAKFLDFPLTISGNGNFSLVSNYIAGTSNTASTRQLTMTRGNLIINNTSFVANSFSSNTADPRGLYFTGTTGKMTLTGGSNASSVTVWDTTNGSNFVLSGNAIIDSTFDAPSLTGGNSLIANFGNLQEQYAPDISLVRGSYGFNLGNLNNNILTISGSVGSVNLLGLAGSFVPTGTGNAIFKIYGNLFIPVTGGSVGTNTYDVTFAATSGIKTIDTSARPNQSTSGLMSWTYNFDGIGGNWILANNIIGNTSIASIKLRNGTLDFNQKTVSLSNIQGIAGGNAGFKNLNTTLQILNNGNLTALQGTINNFTSNTATANSNIFYFEGPFTANRIQVTFSGQAIVNSNITTSWTGGASFDVSGSTSTLRVTSNGNILVGGELQHTSGNMIVESNGVISADRLTSGGTVVRKIELEGNINLRGNSATGNTVTLSGANLTANGNGFINLTDNTASSRVIIGPNTAAAVDSQTLNFKVTNGSGILTFSGNVKDFDLSGYSGNLGNVPNIFGNVTLSSTMLFNQGTMMNVVGNTNTTFTSSGLAFGGNITINKQNGVLTLNDSLTMSGGSGNRFATLQSGNLNLNGFTLTTGFISLGLSSVDANLIHNTGNLILTGGGSGGNTLTSTNNFKTFRGNGVGRISTTTNLIANFIANGGNFANSDLDLAGPGQIRIDSAQFNSIKFSYGNTGPGEIRFDSLTTSGIQGGTAPDKMLRLYSNSYPSQANMFRTNTANANIVTDYIKSNSISFFPTTSAVGFGNGTQPIRWYLGSNSINERNTIGAVLADNDGVTGPVIYYITSGTSWTVPTDWKNGNNTVHLWGGGGASTGSRAGPSNRSHGAAGGGGGGYSRVQNIPLTPGTSVSYSIGAGGIGTAANLSNVFAGNGGNTIFNAVYVAEGGKGSYMPLGGAGGTTGIGGAGGIGLTSNGGNGGNSFEATSGRSAGGGGGGAGGPFGKGGNGGSGGTITNNSTLIAMPGGGGGSGGGTNGNDAANVSTSGIQPNSANGGQNYLGNGGGIGASGTAGTEGILGGGGAGGNVGGRGIDIFGTLGGAGGAGGSQSTGVVNLGVGNLLGAGAGGPAATNPSGTAATGAGSNGAPGGIVIVFYPQGSVVSSSGGMFLIF